MNRFREEFGVDPAAMFEEWESLGEVNDWRNSWKHSPKQYDYAGTVVTILMNWGVKEGKLRRHHCSFDKVYKQIALTLPGSLLLLRNFCQ